MSRYTIRTDACEAEFEADTIDAAAKEFARDERIGGVATAADLVSAIDRIGDGAWVCIYEGDDLCPILQSEQS